MGSCYNSIEINKPITRIWDTICDFYDLSWASGVVTSVTKIGDKAGYEVGAKRLINEAIYETLIAINEEEYTFSYSIDDGPGPIGRSVVDNYIGVVKLSKSDHGTLVEWSSSFESDHEQQVSEFCDPIYRAFLSALNETLA